MTGTGKYEAAYNKSVLTTRKYLLTRHKPVSRLQNSFTELSEYLEIRELIYSLVAKMLLG